jgi:DnaJ-class molecular chaperone
VDSNAIRGWLAILDEVSYYELLGVDPRAGADSIRHGFYRFAASFHPDGHAMRTPEERYAINTIFKRGTEAYRVLSDTSMRVRYDEARPQGNQQARATVLQPRPAGVSMSMRAPPTLKPSVPPSGGATGSVHPSSAPITGRLEDFVRQSRARPFAQQAEQLAKKKEYGKAKLQLKLAMNMDPGNPALEGYLKELDQQIAAAKSKPPA